MVSSAGECCEQQGTILLGSHLESSPDEAGGSGCSASLVVCPLSDLAYSFRHRMSLDRKTRKPGAWHQVVLGVAEGVRGMSSAYSICYSFPSQQQIGKLTTNMQAQT